MSFIVFLGCDGSGKSTVISRLTEELISRGIDVRSGHWCPIAGGNGRPADASEPHSKPKRSTIPSVAKLALLWLRWWRAWIFGGWGKASRSGMVLFDRYHGDLWVDPSRYRYGGPLWMARLWMNLLPKPDHLLFLDAEPEVLLARKQEVSREALIRSRANYHDLVNRVGGQAVDAARPVATIVEEILELVLNDTNSRMPKIPKSRS